jgi:HD-GYP domain-containing protein (c-di-GMP phosphodiesterase class II)
VSSNPDPGTARRRLHNRATIAYVSVVVSLALGLSVVGWLTTREFGNTYAVLVLAGLGITSWLLREIDVGARIHLSFLSIILLTSAVVVGPVGAAVVGAAAATIQKESQPLIVRLFNVALCSSIGSLGGLVYLWAGGLSAPSGDDPAGRILLLVGLPLMVADVAQCLLNAALISGVVRFSAGTPVRTQFFKLLTTSGAAYVGYGVIGFLFVVLWLPAGVGWFSSVLVLAPLFVARWAFVQYGDELRAHDRTLRALVTAVETKDPSNRGHSDRTAQLAEWLAETLGLGHKEIQDVRTAAMLHDIGKVCVPSKVLRARQQLTDDQLVVLAGHALSAVELVHGIDFVTDSLDGIAHHHERFDGRGYPAALKGEDIPLAARLVAVADTFDTLTTSRSYRDAIPVDLALEVVSARAGTQFDPAVVDALKKVLARHPWATTERTPEELVGAPVTLDHDEPEISDLFADRRDLRARVKGATSPGALPVGGLS